MSCALLGAHDLMHHAEKKLGIKAGGTTSDGVFTLAHAECQAACTEAPTLQVNYRYRLRVTPADLENLIDNLRDGKLKDEFPPHGVLSKVRQTIGADRAVGAKAPEDVNESPAWLDGKAALGANKSHTTLCPPPAGWRTGGRALGARKQPCPPSARGLVWDIACWSATSNSAATAGHSCCKTTR